MRYPAIIYMSDQDKAYYGSQSLKIASIVIGYSHIVYPIVKAYIQYQTYGITGMAIKYYFSI